MITAASASATKSAAPAAAAGTAESAAPAATTAACTAESATAAATSTAGIADPCVYGKRLWYVKELWAEEVRERRFGWRRIITRAGRRFVDCAG